MHVDKELGEVCQVNVRQIQSEQPEIDGMKNKKLWFVIEQAVS